MKLDQPGKPVTSNCAGYCVACLADHGDPDCVEIMLALNGRDGYAVAPFTRVRVCYAHLEGLHMQTLASPTMRTGRAGDLVNTILSDAVPALWVNTKYVKD